MTQSPTIRRAARVLLLDPQGRVLLFRWCDPDNPARSFWITPGGGLNEGETHRDAAARELYEETGLTDHTIGAHVGSRQHIFEFEGNMLDQREHFFLVQWDGQTPIHPGGAGDAELKYLAEHRWWSADDILANTAERFAPPRLGEFLHTIINEGSPSEPIDFNH